ncbi:MAG: peptidylprolyl isomerase [Campylobacterota bacterium]|nr:peptidylprolyl isomerase [Campylobacterota bacterium]
MTKITNNTLVTMNLKLESENGDFLDESEKLMYLQGHGQIFKKLEDELESKVIGDTFNLLLQPIDAFGEYNESLVVTESLEDLPLEIEVGMDLDGEDESIVWIVESIEDTHAILNANHELAGIALRVSGEILELEQLSDEGVQKILHMEDDHEH